MRGEESSDSESGRMEESSVRRSLETLCQELNMDEQTATEAMDNFTAIWNTYTLEVRNVRQPAGTNLKHLRTVKVAAADLLKLSSHLKLQRSVGHKQCVKGLQPAAVLVI